MEDVLDLYAEAYGPRRPVMWFDELPYQLVAEVNAPLPAEPGKPKRQDYEYERKGQYSLFIAFEPLTGQRQVNVRERRTNADFAQQLQLLVASFPEAEVIRVVLDNLSTHTPAALCQTFPADEARRLTQKLEFHYTPSMARGSICGQAQRCRFAQDGWDRMVGARSSGAQRAPS